MKTEITIDTVKTVTIQATSQRQSGQQLSGKLSSSMKFVILRRNTLDVVHFLSKTLLEENIVYVLVLSVRKQFLKSRRLK